MDNMRLLESLCLGITFSFLLLLTAFAVGYVLAAWRSHHARKSLAVRNVPKQYRKVSPNKSATVCSFASRTKHKWI